MIRLALSLAMAAVWFAAEARAQTAPIDPSVYERYTPKNFPRVFMLYGELAVLGPIQKLREEAANYAANQPGCGKVLYSEFSEADSRPHPAKWVVFADCTNGVRYYVDYDGAKWTKKIPIMN